MYCRDYCAMLNNGCSVTNFHNVHANHTGYVWWQMSETRGHCFIPLRVCIAWNRYLSAVHCDKNFAWSGVKSCRWPAVPTCDLRTTLTLSFHKFTKYTVGKNVLLSVFFFLFLLHQERTPLRNKLNCWYVTPYQSQRHVRAVTKSQQCSTGWQIKQVFILIR